MNKAEKTFHFISHTHWDREWYLTFEQFRFRLVHLIDNLMDLLERDPHFSYFHLDGQTIVLEDYLEIRPSQRTRLERFIREGRILVGPWYQQNDLFLTSAESTVRNLLEGIRVSRELGGEMKVGYLPDHFGLIGQMPQIFRGVGIDNSIFGRGYDLEKHGSSHICWRAPDGSEVTGILMAHWYNNAQRLPNDNDTLKHLFDEIKAREEGLSPIPHYLMMNGVDHLEAQENLSEVLETLRGLYKDCTFAHDTLPTYVRTLAEHLQAGDTYPNVEGEFRERDDYAILGGTLSSRIYLKQANLACHDLLEKWVEPLSTWCALLELESYDHETIRYLWKLYMKNHPHDSICGCSQDEVHEHMMDRFASVAELADEIVDRKVGLLANQMDASSYEPGDQRLVVVNTAQLENRAVIETPLYFLAEDTVTQFSLEDDQGRGLPYRIVSRTPSRIQVLSPINLPGVLEVQRIDIEWQPEAPPLGYASYRVRAHQEGHVVDEAGEHPPVLENEHLKVEVHDDGSFDVTNKRTGEVVRGLGRLEDTGDRGDLYVYTSVEGEVPSLWRSSVVWDSCTSNALFAECRYRFTWHLPSGLNRSSQVREKEKVSCPFEVTLRLDRGASHLKVRVEVDNHAKDHRLRLLFPLPERASSVWAGGQFDVVERAWNEGAAYERDCNAQPYWKWVAPLYGQGGLALYAKGLHEYEMLGGGQTVALTLLRCVENIMLRDDVPLETDVQPKGQCLGKQAFELAIRPFTDETATRLYQEAELYHQGVKAKLAPVDDARWTRGRAWVQGSSSGSFTRPDPNAKKGRLPSVDALLELTGGVMVSAIKWAEDGQGPVLRLYNVEPSVAEVSLAFSTPVATAVKLNLLEEPLSEPMPASGAVHLHLEPKKIESYGFPKRRSPDVL